MGQQLTEGNIDLYARPHVKNPDGSVSTVRSMSFEEDGKEILIPTVSDDGRIMSPTEAIREYHRTGKNLGVFANPQSATTYAQQLHNDYAAGKYDNKPMPRRIKTPDGITHLFPDDATDQEISAALQVRTPAVSAFEMGRQSAAPEPSGGMSQWFEQNLRPLLAQVAHPKTIDDIASLLIPDAGLSATVRAGGRGTAAVGRGVERAATAPVVQRAADAMGTAGAAGEIFHGSPMAGAATAGAAIAAPRVAAAAGRGLQRAGNAIERAATEAPLAEQATSRVESVSGGRAPQGGPPPEPSPAARPAKSPQQALNEEAIARRRAEYQAKQQAPPEAPKAEPTPAKPTMNAEESRAYFDLREAGKTDQQARETIRAAKEINAKYNLQPPTAAEKKFPKGMRGKVSDKPPLTPEQQAAIQKNRQ